MHYWEKLCIDKKGMIMIEELKQYIYDNDLHNKAISYFWKAFANWKESNPKDYEKKFGNSGKEAIEPFLHAIGLRASEWPDCDYSHITLTVLIPDAKKEYYGTYTVWFSLKDNNIDDDFLEI